MVAAAHQLLAIDRAHEGAWRALMRAYAARGERGMAIQAYERCRSVLADQLDAHPSEETQRVAADIRAAAPVSRPVLAPPPMQLRPDQRLSDLRQPDQRQSDQRQSDQRQSDQRLSDQRQPDQRQSDQRLPEQRMLARPQPRAETRQDRSAEPRAEPRPPAARGGARVGVLPLQLIGTTEAEAHLATGLADEITAALARFRWMFLVSSSSLARFAAQTRDETAVRRAFGIDFLLDGSIHRVPDRLRVALRLLDLRAGNQVVWSRRFDRELKDLLTLQDEVAAEVVAQLDPEILLIEGQRLAARPSTDVTAYELVLRALPLLPRLDREQFMQAGELLSQAIAQEPDYAAAHSWYAFWHIFLFGQAWASDAEAVTAEAGKLANRAVALDPHDARGLSIAGHVRAFLHRRLREALALHERALTVNPNLVMAWALSAAAFTFLGNLDEAERRMRRYKKLSPLDPHAFFYDTVFILIALLKHDHEAAVAAGREVSEMNPAFSAACKPYLAALGHLGRLDEAALVRERLLSIEPGFCIEAFLATSPFERTEDRLHYAAGLRLAGLAE